MIKMKDIMMIEVPLYPRLIWRDFWKFIKTKENWLRYFPDYKDSQLPERPFLFNVLNTLDSKFIKEKISLVEEEKVTEQKIEENEVIIIRRYILEEIAATKAVAGTNKIINLNRNQRKSNTSNEEICKLEVREEKEKAERHLPAN